MTEKLLSAKASETKRATATSQQKVMARSLNTPYEQIMHLQQTLGNQAVQRLYKASEPQTTLKIVQPNADKVMRIPGPVIQRAEQKCYLRSDVTELKTEKVKDAPIAYYGASFNHTFPSIPEGCNLRGVEVSEVIDTVRDDFRIGATNVPLGRKIWTLTAQNKLNEPDKIWTQAGLKGLGANPVNQWPAILDQNQLFYYRSPGNKNWQLGPGIMIKLTLSGDVRRRESLEVTTTDHGISRTEPYRGPAIRLR